MCFRNGPSDEDLSPGTPELPWRKANTDVFILPSCSFAGSLPGCSERNFSPKLKFEPGFGATGGREFEFKWKVQGDKATLDDLDGKDLEHVKERLQGEYTKKS